MCETFPVLHVQFNFGNLAYMCGIQHRFKHHKSNIEAYSPRQATSVIVRMNSLECVAKTKPTFLTSQSKFLSG